jgi:hypothetical protein
MTYFEYIDQRAEANLFKWLEFQDHLALSLYIFYSTERERLRREKR